MVDVALAYSFFSLVDNLKASLQVHQDNLRDQMEIWIKY